MYVYKAERNTRRTSKQRENSINNKKTQNEKKYINEIPMKLRMSDFFFSMCMCVCAALYILININEHSRATTFLDDNIHRVYHIICHRIVLKYSYNIHYSKYSH